MKPDYKTDYLVFFPENNLGQHRWISQEVMSQLLARAINTWSDAPPEAKELHDLVIHGVALQNYREQASQPQEN